MSKIFSFDRLEGDMAICVSDDDEVVVLPAATLKGLAVRDVFSADVLEGGLVNIIPEPCERERRVAESRARLYAIARKRKDLN